MNKFKLILKHDFEAASGLTVSDIFCGDEEVIHVMTNDGEYTMLIGSDDDDFYFTSENGRTVRFEFSAEWLEGEQRGWKGQETW